MGTAGLVVEVARMPRAVVAHALGYCSCEPAGGGTSVRLAESWAGACKHGTRTALRMELTDYRLCVTNASRFAWVCWC